MTQRLSIRKRVVDLLKERGTDAGSRIYPTMVKKLHPAILPCILVYTRSESSEVYDESPKSYRKTLTLGIECVAEKNELLDDTLDTLSGQVEAILAEEQYLHNADGEPMADDVLLKTVENVIAGDGDIPAGAAIMTVEVTYIEDAVCTGDIAPHTLVPFKSVQLDTKPKCGTTQPDTPTEKDEIALEWE